MGKLESKIILVVDDEPDLREIIADELQLEGAQTLQASNGNEAADIAYKQKIDAIISDIRMPGGDGVFLLDKVREKYPELPIVMLITGFSDLTVEDAYHKGANAFFSKPFDMELLISELVRQFSEPKVRWKRKHERVETNLSIQLKFENMSTAIQAKIINLGRGGMFVQMENNLPLVNGKVEFKFELTHSGEGLFEGLGICKWRRDESKDTLLKGVGIEFLELSDTSIEKLLKELEILKTKSYIPKQ